jgi:cytochrome c553
MQQAITSYLRVALTPFVLAGLAACSTSGIGTTTVAADGIEQGKLPCPQRRDTERAPASYYSRLNPLPRTATNLEQGRLLYLEDGKPMSCASCHGVKGDGAWAIPRPSTEEFRLRRDHGLHYRRTDVLGYPKRFRRLSPDRQARRTARRAPRPGNAIYRNACAQRATERSRRLAVGLVYPHPAVVG